MATPRARITFFDKNRPYYEFSNFAPYPVHLHDRAWATVENYYQAQKFYQPDNPRAMQYYDIISQADSPMKAFLLANQMHASGFRALWMVNKLTMRELINDVIDRFRDVMIRSDWDVVKVDIMREAVHEKFTNVNHEAIRHLLCATGDAELVEANTNDSFWGSGRDGRGQNQLGRILMDIRAELRN